MTWVVDAMNVVGTRPDGWWRDRAGALGRLLAAVRRFAATTGDRIVVVVDGPPLAALPAGETDGVAVVYARRRGPDAADDRIVELVATAPDAGALRIVTSDRALRARVLALGAAAETASAWLARLDAAPDATS
jgi:predicted RNA-binding protein with PIN domain